MYKRQLQAQVKQMEVALAQAETNLAYSYIRAPFAGYVAAVSYTHLTLPTSDLV